MNAMDEETAKTLANNLRKEAGALGDKARNPSKLSDTQATAALVLQGIANAIDQTFPAHSYHLSERKTPHD